MPSVALSRDLIARLKYVVDPRGVRDVGQSTDELEEMLGELETAFRKLTEPLSEVSNLGGQFETLGIQIQEYGRRITDTMGTFATDYISNMEGADATSQEWLETTQKLDQAHVRFGRTSAQSILPLLKLQTEIVEKASTFLDKYPELAQVAFGIGTAVVLASSLTNAVTKGIRLIADVKLVALEAQRVIAAKLMRDAANKQVIAATIMKKSADQQLVSDLRGKFVDQGGGLAGRAGGTIRGLAGRAGGALGGLGVSGVLSIGAIVASLAAIGVAFNRFSKRMDKNGQDITNKWDTFLEKSTKTNDSAIDILDDYRDAQDDVSKAYDRGGILADVFVNRSQALNANIGSLSKALITGSKNYEDYETAIDRFNETLRDGERPLKAISREQYNYRIELEKTRNELITGQASLKEYGRVLAENGNIINKIVGTTLYAIGEIQEGEALEELLDDWIDYQEERKRILKEGEEERIAAWSEFSDGMKELEKQTGEDREAAVREYEANLLQLELDTATQRENIVQNMRTDVTNIEKNIAQDRQQAMEDFHAEATQAEEDYYKERTEAAANFGIEVRRSEEDHQRALRKMREESQLRQFSAIRARDALALIEERRSYEKERRDSEEEHAIDMARRSEDFARQMAQMEQNFREQQAARDVAFKQQLAELEKRLKEETKLREDSGEEQLAELEDSRVNQLRSLNDQKETELDTIEEENEKQTGELKKGLNARLNEQQKAQRESLQDARNNFDRRRQEVGLWNSRELDEYRNFRDRSLSTLKSFVSQANIELQGLRVPSGLGGNIDGHQSGGYADYGLHRLGEGGREFVMSNPTTRAAERLAGGRLTQDRLLSAMSRPGGQVNNHFVFQGRLSEDEKEQYRVIAYEQSLNALRDVMKEVN